MAALQLPKPGGGRDSLMRYPTLNSPPVLESAASADPSEHEAAPFEQIITYRLWDDPFLAFDEAQQTLKGHAYLDNVLHKLSKIERSYAKDVAKLAKSVSESAPRELGFGKGLRGSVQHLAAMLLLCSQEHDSLADVLRMESSAKAGHKTSMNEHGVLRNKVKSSAKKVEKKESEYRGVIQDMEELEKHEKAKLQPRERILWRKHISQRKRNSLTKMEASMQELRIGGHMLRTVHHELLTFSLDSLQQLLIERGNVMRKRMAMTVKGYSQIASVLWKKCLNTTRAVKRWSAVKDLKMWVNDVAKGRTCPWIEIKDPKEAPAPGSANSSLVSSTRRGTLNPFARDKLLTKYNTVVQSNSVEQVQQRENKKKFEVAKKHKKRAKELGAQRKREAKARLLAEQKAKERLLTERQEQIKQLEADKALVQAQLDKQRDDVEKADKDRDKLIDYLLKQMEDFKREKEELENALEKKVDAVSVAATSSMDDLEVSELKIPIIIDCGSAYHKIGFCGEPAPALVIPNLLAEYEHPLAKVDPDYSQSRGTALGATALHLAMSNSASRVNTQVFCDAPENWQDMETLFEYLFTELGVNPREHPVMLTQPVLPPTVLQADLTELMFEKFKVPALYIASAPQLTAYAYGQTTGLVVDIGHSSAQVVPMEDGYLLDEYTARSKHLGGARDTRALTSFLAPRAGSGWSEHLAGSDHALERTDSKEPDSGSGDDDEQPALQRVATHMREIHDKLVEEDMAPAGAGACELARAYVTAASIKDQLAFAVSSPDDYVNMCEVFDTVQEFVGSPDADPDMDSKKAVDDDGDIQKMPLALHRELLDVGEMPFQPRTILRDQEASLRSVPEMIKSVVDRCNPQTRKKLLSNIFLSGGVCTMPGFAERLEDELRTLLPWAAPYIHVYASEARYGVWAGGSALSTLEEFQEQWVFLEDYLEAQDMLDEQEQLEQQQQQQQQEQQQQGAADEKSQPAAAPADVHTSTAASTDAGADSPTDDAAQADASGDVAGKDQKVDDVQATGD